MFNTILLRLRTRMQRLKVYRWKYIYRCGGASRGYFDICLKLWWRG